MTFRTLRGGARADTHDLRSIGGRVYNAFLSQRVEPGVHFLDVPVLSQARSKPRRLFKDKIHFSAEGSQLVATALAPLIEAALPALQR